MKRVKVGEFAKILGVSTQTVRVLEKKGILHPLRSDSGTRYYSERNLQEAVNRELISQSDMDEYIKNQK